MDKIIDEKIYYKLEPTKKKLLTFVYLLGWFILLVWFLLFVVKIVPICQTKELAISSKYLTGQFVLTNSNFVQEKLTETSLREMACGNSLFKKSRGSIYFWQDTLPTSDTRVNLNKVYSLKGVVRKYYSTIDVNYDSSFIFLEDEEGEIWYLEARDISGYRRCKSTSEGTYDRTSNISFKAQNESEFTPLFSEELIPLKFTHPSCAR